MRIANLPFVPFLLDPSVLQRAFTGLLLCLVANLQFKGFDSKSLHEHDHFGNLLNFLGQALFLWLCLTPCHS